MQNFGIIYLKNGSKYYGYFTESKLEDLGEFYEISTGNNNENVINKTYLGYFKKHKKNGFGILTEDKDNFFVYNGSFEKNKKKGYGIIYKNKIKYAEGIFDNDNFIKGWIYIESNDFLHKIEANSFEFDINHKEYIPHGYGTIYFKNNSKLECNLDNILTKIKENNFNITGIYYLANGKIYEGTIENYKINGYGRIWENGNINYVGQFKNEVFDGFGTQYLKNGSIYKGFFEKGFKVFFFLNILIFLYK